MKSVRNHRCLTGAFTADNTRKRLANIPGSSGEDLEKFVVKKIYKVDLAENPTLGFVSRILDIAPYVVVVKTESSQSIPEVIGAITSDDLLMLISASDQSPLMNAEAVSGKTQNGNVPSPVKRALRPRQQIPAS